MSAQPTLRMHPAAAWAVLVVASLGVFLGGAELMVVAIALPLVRYLTVWSGLALIGVFIAIQARQIPLANDYLNANVVGRLGSQLTLPIGPTWLRMAGVALMALAVVAFVASLALVRGPGRGSVEDVAEGHVAAA